MRAVIIEDEKKARDVIRRLLGFIVPSVYVVGEADNPREGMRLIAQVLPDIVFLDIRMPHMSGIDMIRKLKERQIETSYVIVSGYDDFRYAQECIRLDVAEYILKPVSLEDLEQVLNRLRDRIGGYSVAPEVRKKLPVMDIHEIEAESKNRSVRLAIRYIHNNMGLPCRLSAVAAELKISPEHLSRLFHEEMQMTFTDYVKAVKIDYVCVLLRKSDLKINEAARAAGFENEKYFSNLFRDTIGMTPRQYRNQFMQ